LYGAPSWDSNCPANGRHAAVPLPGGDDSHAFDLPPGNLRRRLDDLIRQLGGNVTQPADNSLARETQQALGIPAPLPKPHQFGCRIGRLSQICQKVIDSWSQIHGLGANVVVPGA
jgi:hypothetical protein